ncbi:MAG: AarF/ABC1/UbiB kinase family protein [Patescibacteria group bacterium]|nr:AarF/ABC1/UbiB kinase family protein [Patescibacteria group bacterium]
MFSRFENLRKFKRSRQIMVVLVKYGLDYFIDRSKINLLTKIKKNPKNYQALTLPERLRLALEELGPTFIKFGQILSTRPDFLPPTFIKELAKLQDQVPPFDSSEMQKVIKQEFNKSIDELFKKFEKKPVAAASLSQVYKAVTVNGEIVAVKIQRPNIKEIVKLDLEILEDLAGILENRLHNGWVYHPKLMIREFKNAIRKELDFTNEAHNFEKFRINFKEIDYVRVPKIYWDITTTKVLTMEFINGIKINETTQEEYKNIFRPKQVAERGAEVILKQILEDGFFHADPHPANLFVLPPATIVMLDVGMVGYLDKKTIISGAKLLQAIIDKNLDQAMRCFENLGIAVKEFDRNLLCQDLKELLNRYLGVSLKNLEINKVSQDILEVMARHNLVLPANLVLMLKALSVVETTGRQLYPDFDMLSAAKPFVKKLLRKRFAPQELLKKSGIIFQESVELIEQLPQDLIDILRKVKEGKLKFNFEHRGLEKLILEIDRASNRLSFSMIIGALIIGSSFVIQANIGPFIFSYPAIGIIGYLFASFLGLFLIISILRSGRWK